MSSDRILTVTAIMSILIVGAIQARQVRIQSDDLRIPSGDKIVIDNRLIGTAPCAISLKTSVRHKCEIKTRDGNVRTVFLTTKELKKSQEVENIPAWFVNPTMLQTDFPAFTQFTTATAVATSLRGAVDRAGVEARRKIPKGMINRYTTIREGQGRLDSTNSRTYPQLTRGQMDSLADVNGGLIVANSLSSNTEPTYLEYEIQKLEKDYRVYLLAGNKK